MNRVSSALLIAAVALAAGVAGFALRQGMPASAAAAAQGAALSGEALLGLTLADPDGVEQPLAQWRGKVLVINFWATWCPPCLKEIPEFAAVSRRHAEAPVQFVGISIDSIDNVRTFRAEVDVPYPLLMGSTQTLKLAADLAGSSVQALPITAILDRRGDVHHIRLGILSEADLEAIIAAALAR